MVPNPRQTSIGRRHGRQPATAFRNRRGLEKTGNRPAFPYIPSGRPVFPADPGPLRRIRAPIDVTLVGPPEFVYFPAPPEFLIGARTRQDVVVDIRPFLRRRHGHFLEDRIVGIDDAGRTILTASGARHGNGALFLGTGPTFRKDTTPGTREFIC